MLVDYINYNKSVGKYCVQKWINGKVEHFGSFKKFEDAEEHRDYCLEHNWSERCKINQVGSHSPRRRIAHMFGLEEEDIP